MALGPLGRLGGVLLQPRRALRAVADGAGGIGEVLVLLVVLLFAENAAHVARVLAAAPYLGASGLFAGLVAVLGGAIPELLALLLGAGVMAALSRRRGRELDVAAYAL